MAGFEKLKLSKQLLKSVAELGYNTPKDIQQKTLNRIIGGQDVVGVAPEGAGKTTTYILSTLTRFNHAPEGVPKVLILVPEKEDVLAVIEMFDRLNKNKSIAIVGLYVTPGIEAQMDALAEGADIVVATPDRARAIYLKLGLNLNKMELFIVDDADRMIKKGMQLPIAELANSITKAQHLVFTDVMHSRVEKMIEPFMKAPAIVEIDELEETELAIHHQLLYNVPNFLTKQNLLNLFMNDEEVFTKTAVFVNNQATAEKVYQSLHRRMDDAVGFLNPKFFDVNGYKTVEEFKSNADARVMLVVTENNDEVDLSSIPFLIHFDIPQETDTYVNRVTNTNDNNETIALTFATDMELSLVKKIEHATGNKMEASALPEDLVIVNESKARTEPKQSAKKEENEVGSAFHEKKASNSKDYNFSASKKAAMNKKKKHG
ncbi:DEAD/DEAH box helicase [Mucilaginibacter sp. dw_454]|uniref:DEAD/DEAH box helicase n=1 Tax=Mucilaginibacter sp. dw_454 TaxID=2720079 RepID=UPI001BD6ACA7|nr:DEAD/DEAH box helicase [Mucilaginibacter sp. dw_454]